MKAKQAANTALLAGATGLIGAAALQRLLADTTFKHVVAVVRRPLDLAHPAFEMVCVSGLPQLAGTPPVAARAGLSALGTTMAKAGSQEAFRKVDHDGVLAFARWVRAGGARTFVLVSSAGASPAASVFYLRVKGETEEEVGRIGFPRLVILRPGLLLGQRQEPRLGERIAQGVLGVLDPMMRGPLGRFRAIPAETVAAAMVNAAASDEAGRFVWADGEIRAAAAQTARQAGAAG